MIDNKFYLIDIFQIVCRGFGVLGFWGFGFLDGGLGGVAVGGARLHWVLHACLGFRV